MTVQREIACNYAVGKLRRAGKSVEVVRLYEYVVDGARLTDKDLLALSVATNRS